MCACVRKKCFAARRLAAGSRLTAAGRDSHDQCAFRRPASSNPVRSGALGGAEGMGVAIAAGGEGRREEVGPFCQQHSPGLAMGQRQEKPTGFGIPSLSDTQHKQTGKLLPGRQVSAGSTTSLEAVPERCTSPCPNSGSRAVHRQLYGSVARQPNWKALRVASRCQWVQIPPSRELVPWTAPSSA
jgi:hypothetical protein